MLEASFHWSQEQPDQRKSTVRNNKMPNNGRPRLLSFVEKVVLFWSVLNYWGGSGFRITTGHWPFSVHFLGMAGHMN